MQPSADLVQRPRLRRADRRRHHRVDIALLGRYMLANRQEYPCQTINMSPGGILLTAPVQGKLGERVVMYLEHVGRVEGQIARHTEQGFAVSLAATSRKREKLASQLTWLANRHALGLPEDRRHERITPRNAIAIAKIDGERETTVRLIDVSLSGAAFSIDTPPPIGTPIILGKTPGKVVRHFQGGVAVEFLLTLSPDRFDENIVL